MIRSAFHLSFAVTLGLAVAFITVQACQADSLKKDASSVIGVSADKILLGELTSLAGSNLARSLEFKKGSDLFISVINSTGGVEGRKIEVRSLDNDYDPKKAVADARRLIDQDKIFSFYNIYGTPIAKSIVALVDQFGIPMVAPLSSAEFLRKPVNPHIFSIRPSSDEEALEMVDFLVEKRGIKEISLFIQDDALGATGLSSAQKAFNKHGIKRIGSSSYKRNSVDVGSAIEELRKGNPKAVMVYALPQATVAFIRESYARGFKPVFIGHSGSFSMEMAQALKELKAEYFYVQSMPSIEGSPYEIVQRYVKDALGAKQIPNEQGMEGYLGAAILVEGLKRAGKELTRERFEKSLENMTDVEIGGLPLSFSRTNHQALARPFLMRMFEGKSLPAGN